MQWQRGMVFSGFLFLYLAFSSNRASRVAWLGRAVWGGAGACPDDFGLYNGFVFFVAPCIYFSNTPK